MQIIGYLLMGVPLVAAFRKATSRELQVDAGKCIVSEAWRCVCFPEEAWLGRGRCSFRGGGPRIHVGEIRQLPNRASALVEKQGNRP